VLMPCGIGEYLARRRTDAAAEGPKA